MRLQRWSPPYQDNASARHLHSTDTRNRSEKMIRKWGFDMEKILQWIRRFDAASSVSAAQHKLPVKNHA
jgi:N6-adenosine-specific RNA methylase IME4